MVRTLGGGPVDCSDSRQRLRGAGAEPGRRQGPPLPPPGHPERWQRLQQLRRGQLPLDPWFEALRSGAQPPDPELLAALWRRFDRPGVERLLVEAPRLDAPGLVQALRGELAELAADGWVRQAWLEPLLAHLGPEHAEAQSAWLELVGHFRDPRVAALLRRALRSTALPQEARPALLPLLGWQRQAEDGEPLLTLARAPGPLPLRRAALEALSVGLSAWPPQPLTEGLRQLAGDLDEGLAAASVDLLARLPHGQQALMELRQRPLAPSVAARLQRRLRRSPLVLVVHGRQGGLIPEGLRSLARELEQRRGAPVQLQALTAAAPPLDPRLRLAASRAGRLTVVPLLLLPGGHVRHDLPRLAADWRAWLDLEPPLPGAEAPRLRRLPFLGSWPLWQRLLRQQLDAAAGDRPLLWLHHPLEGPLGQRFLMHLARVLERPGRPVAYQAEPSTLQAVVAAAPVLAPLTLAPNRLSESLNMDRPGTVTEVLPPLLDLPAVRDCLLTCLEALP